MTAFPLTGSARRICTVHDLAWHHVPGSYGALDRFRQRRWTALAAARADRIIVVSESTRRDLAALHPAAAGKLVVIPPGVGESFFEPPGRNEVDRVRKRYGLDGRYLIAVSGFHPRKNLPNLVKAYDRFRDGSPERVPLVIAGRGGGDSARLGRRILESPHRRDIILTGYVPQEDLRPLYAGADLMVFPSRFEGFGIPALEAMACGTPVLVSDLPVFREVCGEAALRVDPADPGSIAGGITLSLRGDPERSGRIACGIERARTYRWAESARRLREVFHETAGGGA